MTHHTWTGRVIVHTEDTVFLLLVPASPSQCWCLAAWEE